MTRVKVILDRFPAVPFDRPGHVSYGSLRAALRAQGTPIGPTDPWIAAHALALNVTLVTHNRSEFRRVPGLVLENWLE